jgi:4-amino-4-deoxy-L-arabinose transferase-like glycosyltransferase
LKRRILHILLILAVAAGIRLASYVAIKDGPVPYLHHWTESDMFFFNEWSREIAAGDWLSREAGRPFHSWHDHIARRVHQRSGSSEPYGPAVRDEYWDRWLGERVFYQDPFYPYALAGLRALGQDPPGIVFFLQGLLGLGTSLLVYLVTLRLFGDSAGLIAGLMAALYGPLILFESVLLRESLITFLVVASVASGLKALENPDRRGWLLMTGALCGLAFMVKSSALLFLPAFLAILAHRLKSLPRSALAAAGLCLLGFGILLSPLAARNVAVGAPPWAAAGSGPITFVNHNAADYRGDMGDTLSEYADEVMEESGGRFIPAVMATLNTHTGAGSWPKLVFQKLLAFWHWYETPNNTSYDYFRMEVGGVAIAFLGFGVIAPLALAGYLLGFRRKHEFVLACVPLMAGLFTVAIFYHLSRFRLPVAVAMIPFAAMGVVAIGKSILDRKYTRMAVALVVVILSGSLIWRPLPAGHSRIRLSDYGVANEIALNVARLKIGHDDLPGAVALLERQLTTQPEDLKQIRPGPGSSSISPLSAALSGSYLPLHVEAAELCRGLGRTDRSDYHRRRSAVLQVISRQYENRSGSKKGGSQSRLN